MTSPAPSTLDALGALPLGYSEGGYGDLRWSAAVKASADRRRWSLWAEELGGVDEVSANLYVLEGGRLLLNPCEMAATSMPRVCP